MKFFEYLNLGLKAIMYVILIMFMLDTSFSLRAISERGIIVYPLKLHKGSPHGTTRSQPKRDHQISRPGPRTGGNV